MSGELNAKIIDKIDESDEEKWVKELSKKILRFERDNYTGKGGGYRNEYRKKARDNYGGDK